MHVDRRASLSQQKGEAARFANNIYALSLSLSRCPWRTIDVDAGRPDQRDRRMA